MARKKTTNSDVIQMPLWTPESNWLPPNLADLPQDWNAFKRICIDTETCDPHLRELGPGVRRGAFAVGYSLAFEDGPAYYLPTAHQGGGNMDKTLVEKYLKEKGNAFTGEVVGANLAYDLDYWFEIGVFFPVCKFFRDIQIADPLICELHRSYSLQNIALRFGLPGKDETLLKEAAAAFNLDPKNGLWRLHSKFVGPYAEQDGREPLAILRRQERLIDEQELWDVYNLESKVLPVLVKMRRKGIRVDTNKLEYIENWSLNQEADALAKVKQLTGVTINVGDVWKADHMVPVLEHLGIPIEKTSKGAPSIRKDVLDSIDHDAAKALLWARKVNKLRTTFAQSIRTHMVNGRIHCSYNQLKNSEEDSEDETKGAGYGRLSCEKPNLQQQPSRDEFAAMWRSIYLPEEGELWSANDYSQQEPRMLIHFAEMMKYPRAKEAAEKYRTDPNTDNHQMMAEMAGIPRKPAKELFLGKCYGMGGPKLCRKLHLPTRWALMFERGSGLPTEYFQTQEEAQRRAREVPRGRVLEVAGEEGQKIITRFDAELPFVNMMAKKCQERAKQNGFIKTLSGRRCRFPTDQYGNFDWTHKALNRLIQGSSADQTKQALVDCDAAGFNVLIQVHDEIGFSVKSREEGEAAAEIMRNCIQLNIPSKVDVEVGPSWGEAE